MASPQTHDKCYSPLQVNLKPAIFILHLFALEARQRPVGNFSGVLYCATATSSTA